MIAKPTRPILIYHGGKWRIAPWVISHFPRHKIYIEPFGGGGSVLLRKPKSYTEIYNDLDSVVYNLFLQVRDNGEQLLSKLQSTPFCREEFNKAYEVTADPLENARRLVVKSLQGYGSKAYNVKTGFNSNAKKQHTPPPHNWVNYQQCLPAIIERLRDVIIENKNAVDLISFYDDPDVLFYIDPPYVMSTRNSGKCYLHEMTDEQHVTLAEYLHQVKGKVALSGYHSDLYDKLYSDWRLETKVTQDGNNNNKTECLWMNFAPEGTLFA